MESSSKMNMKLVRQTVKLQYVCLALLLFNCIYGTIVFVSIREFAYLLIKILPFSLLYLASMCSAFLALKDRVANLIYPILVMTIPFLFISLIIWISYVFNFLYCGIQRLTNSDSNLTSTHFISAASDESLFENIRECPPKNWLSLLLVEDNGVQQITTSPFTTAIIAFVVFAQKLMEFVVFRKLMHLFHQIKVNNRVDVCPASVASPKSVVTFRDIAPLDESKKKSNSGESDDDMIVYERVNGFPHVRDNSHTRRHSSLNDRTRNSLPTIKNSKRTIA